jgi:hypothetical protein
MIKFGLWWNVINMTVAACWWLKRRYPLKAHDLELAFLRFWLMSATGSVYCMVGGWPFIFTAATALLFWYLPLDAHKAREEWRKLKRGEL